MENSVKVKNDWKVKRPIRWMLVLYDFLLFFVVSWVLFCLNPSDSGAYLAPEILKHTLIGIACILTSRFAWRVYRQIWRYGGASAFMRMILADICGYIAWYLIECIPAVDGCRAILAFSITAVSLVAALGMRLSYIYFYDHAVMGTKFGHFSRWILKAAGNVELDTESVRETENDGSKIRIAIVGAGRLGFSLADDLTSNPNALYVPVCFIDKDPRKAGRFLNGIPILNEQEISVEVLKAYNVQEIVFALSHISVAEKAKLVDFYQKSGLILKVYDYPSLGSVGGKRQLREFAIEELLFRPQVAMSDEKTRDYYRGKTVLITGGGGSIGSEIVRQLAKMEPKQLVIVDIYENGAYDVQQEIRMAYAGKVDIRVEIVSVTNMRGLERVFDEYHPQIVVMAAAHKHVPLMEKNCIEAVENNVFGTFNTVLASEKAGVERVIMVSTDKAVNPTNVMGATKRMCEMIVMAHAADPKNKTTFSATRFGNVLGSAGSVIPLFRRQISQGGPVTVTDKRIIRYFMTIPEASQLVLQSGAIAKNGELFVLDMGKPVRIYDLAESMIKLSGLVPGEDIEIIETGLRPGEKLYEELLIQSETLTKTENKMIFIEKDVPLDADTLDEKLMMLERAIARNNDNSVKKVLQSVVPTYKPIIAEDTRPMDMFDTDESVEDRALAQLGGKRVLVVDDIELNREISAETLIEIGMEADTADSGEQAFEIITGHEPDYYDYVLMDIVMPGIDGYQTAKEVRAFVERDYSRLPIIAMTANDIPDAEKLAQDAGMNGFLPKPIHLDDLLRIFQTI